MSESSISFDSFSTNPQNDKHRDIGRESKRKNQLSYARWNTQAVQHHHKRTSSIELKVTYRSENGFWN